MRSRGFQSCNIRIVWREKRQTGVIIACCRHGWNLLWAADMCQGELYRRVHFLHYKLMKFRCLFHCYDVIYLYWPWAAKVEANPNLSTQYTGMITKMHAFLSRMHAVAHIWYCYVSNQHIVYFVCTHIYVFRLLYRSCWWHSSLHEWLYLEGVAKWWRRLHHSKYQAFFLTNTYGWKYALKV